MLDDEEEDTMQVSSQTNNFQAMNQYQMVRNQKSDIENLPTLPNPLPPENDPEFDETSKGIYEASKGNIISSKDGTLSLTPQGELNLANYNDAIAKKEDETAQAKIDGERAIGVDYIGYKSKQSQVEIYLSVATQNKVSLGSDDTISIIESLRDVQKQNNIVEAYSTYAKNQKDEKVVLY